MAEIPPPPLYLLRRLIEEGYVQGEGDELEVVDPLLELWIATGRQGLADISIGQVG